MPQKRKYDEATRMRIFDLYCEGKQFAQITEETGVNKRYISAQKYNKWPEDWDKARAERVRKKAEIVEEQALERFEAAHARLQRMYRSVSSHAAGQLQRKAAKDLLPDDIALEAMLKSGEEERKLYLPVADALGLNKPQAGMSFAAMVKGGGEIGVLANLNKLFEEKNGKLIAEARKPADEPSSRDPREDA